MTDPLPPDTFPPGFEPGLELVIAPDGGMDAYIHDQMTRDFYTMLAARKGLSLDEFMTRWLKQQRKNLRLGRPLKQPHE